MNTIPNLPMGSQTAVDRGSLSAAVDFLSAIGFATRIRNVTLEVGRSYGVVAVEVQSGDRRLPWSTGPVPAPVGFNYRLGERGPNSVTLFSGWMEKELDAFVATLGAFAPGFADARMFGGGPAHAEWNPHQLPEAEMATILDHLAKIAQFSWPRPETLTAMFPGVPGAAVRSRRAAKSVQAEQLEAA